MVVDAVVLAGDEIAVVDHRVPGEAGVDVVDVQPVRVDILLVDSVVVGQVHEVAVAVGQEGKVEFAPVVDEGGDRVGNGGDGI